MRGSAVHPRPVALLDNCFCDSVRQQFAIFPVARVTPLGAVTKKSAFHEHRWTGRKTQHAEIGGVRYSHVVDPRTGFALTGRRSVTVVARRGTLSDGLATAASVLGPEKGLKLIKNTPGAGVFYAEERSSGVSTYEYRFPPFVLVQPSGPIGLRTTSRKRSAARTP